MFCFNKNTKSRKSSSKSLRESDLDNQANSNGNSKAVAGGGHSSANQHHGAKSNGTNFSASNNDSNLNNDTNNNSNNAAAKQNDIDTIPAINNLYRYVTAEYHAQADDELSVKPGDVVLVEYTATSSGVEWSHVICFTTNKRGFVRSDILTTDARRNPARKKKIINSSSDTFCQHHHHQHHHHIHPSQLAHQHRHQNHQNSPSKVSHFGIHTSPPSRESIRLHAVPSFKIPHSLEGSCGGQHSFPNLNAPAYYNLATNPICDQEFTIFNREMFGIYVVIYNFVAREENDLSVKPGDFVSVLNKDDPDWYWVKSECDHTEGFVPARFMCDYKQVKSFLDKGNSTNTMKSSNDHEVPIYINQTNGIGPPTDQNSSTCQQT